jgi:hypothetical protein
MNYSPWVLLESLLLLVLWSVASDGCRPGGTLFLYQTQDGWTALISAAQEGHTDCARLLVKAGANKEAKNNVRDVRTIYLLLFGKD